MSNLVSVEWLNKHLNDENIIVFDATMAKVTKESITKEKQIIPNAIFFDIKNTFSDQASKFPNTLPSKTQFEEELQKLGINNTSKIVVYDDLGIYSSPRVWWLFKTFGFDNIFVLNGGLPEWQLLGFETLNSHKTIIDKGNFKANFKAKKVVFIDNLLKSIKDASIKIVDARSSKRFNSEIAEPRGGLRSGKIPNSTNLPYEQVLNNYKLKSKQELEKYFLNFSDETKLVFSCGSGITAAILDLVANEIGYKNTSVYDGSWTEYGTLIKD